MILLGVAAAIEENDLAGAGWRIVFAADGPGRPNGHDRTTAGFPYSSVG